VGSTNHNDSQEVFGRSELILTDLSIILRELFVGLRRICTVVLRFSCLRSRVETSRDLDLPPFSRVEISTNSPVIVYNVNLKF
jgi:hypothetical protein